MIRGIRHCILRKDARNEDGKFLSKEAQAAQAAHGRGTCGAGVESTHSVTVFKILESQVHQLGDAFCWKLSRHTLQLASLAENSGSHAFGGSGGGNGSALGGTPHASLDQKCWKQAMVRTRAHRAVQIELRKRVSVFFCAGFSRCL
jgi:hypothetical protein